MLADVRQELGQGFRTFSGAPWMQEITKTLRTKEEIEAEAQAAKGPPAPDLNADAGAGAAGVGAEPKF